MAHLIRDFKIPRQKHNLHTIKTSPMSELSGSLGDLGTLLPLMIALALVGAIDLPTTLVFTGLSNIMTGLMFEIPLPVQPMKAIAAIAIANRFAITETTSAGLFVSGVIFALSVTGLIGWIGRVVPIPVVKGIQVGAGISLIMSGGAAIKGASTWIEEYKYLFAFLAFLALLLTTRPGRFGPAADGNSSYKAPKIPYALIVTVIGVICGMIAVGNTYEGLPFFFGIWRPAVHIPSSSDFQYGSLRAGLGQLPLTALNSIVAVTHLSAEILPPPTYPNPPSFGAIGVSIGAINLVSGWFGAMPICHGSGGLAGQVKFGARSGASIIILGLIKLVLGLFVSELWLMRVLDGFPRSLLGVMVIAAGLELARVGESLNTSAVDLWVVNANDVSTGDGSQYVRGDKEVRELDDVEKSERWYTMMVTAGLQLAFSNDAVGFLAGLLCHYAIRAPGYWNEWQRRRQGSGEERTGLLSS